MERIEYFMCFEEFLSDDMCGLTVQEQYEQMISLFDPDNVKVVESYEKYFENTYNQYILTILNDSYTVRSKAIINISDIKDKPLLYHCGVSKHAMYLVLLKIDIDNYTVVLTNSGLGTNYHSTDPNNPYRVAAILEYTQINKARMAQICDIINTYTNSPKNSDPNTIDLFYLFLFDVLTDELGKKDGNKMIDDYATNKYYFKKQTTGDCGFKSLLLGIYYLLIVKNGNSLSFNITEKKFMGFFSELGLQSIDKFLTMITAESVDGRHIDNWAFPPNIFEAILQKIRDYRGNIIRNEFVNKIEHKFYQSYEKYCTRKKIDTVINTKYNVADPTQIIHSKKNIPRKATLNIISSGDNELIVNMNINKFLDIYTKYEGDINYYNTIIDANIGYELMTMFLVRLPIFALKYLAESGSQDKQKLDKLVTAYTIWCKLKTEYTHIYKFAWLSIFYYYLKADIDKIVPNDGESYLIEPRTPIQTFLLWVNLIKIDSNHILEDINFLYKYIETNIKWIEDHENSYTLSNISRYAKNSNSENYDSAIDNILYNYYTHKIDEDLKKQMMPITDLRTYNLGPDKYKCIYDYKVLLIYQIKFQSTYDTLNNLMTYYKCATDCVRELYYTYCKSPDIGYRSLNIGPTTNTNVTPSFIQMNIIKSPETGFGPGYTIIDKNAPIIDTNNININNFISFIDTKDINYLREMIVPFMLYGTVIRQDTLIKSYMNSDIQYCNPIIYQVCDIGMAPNNKINECLEHLKNYKLEYNYFIYILLYIGYKINAANMFAQNLYDIADDDYKMLVQNDKLIVVYNKLWFLFNKSDKLLDNKIIENIIQHVSFPTLGEKKQRESNLFVDIEKHIKYKLLDQIIKEPNSHMILMIRNEDNEIKKVEHSTTNYISYSILNLIVNNLHKILKDINTGILDSNIGDTVLKCGTKMYLSTSKNILYLHVTHKDYEFISLDTYMYHEFIGTRQKVNYPYYKNSKFESPHSNDLLINVSDKTNAFLPYEFVYNDGDLTSAQIIAQFPEKYISSCLNHDFRWVKKDNTNISIGTHKIYPEYTVICDLNTQNVTKGELIYVNTIYFREETQYLFYSLMFITNYDKILCWLNKSNKLAEIYLSSYNITLFVEENKVLIDNRYEIINYFDMSMGRWVQNSPYSYIVKEAGTENFYIYIFMPLENDKLLLTDWYEPNSDPRTKFGNVIENGVPLYGSRIKTHMQEQLGTRNKTFRISYNKDMNMPTINSKDELYALIYCRSMANSSAEMLDLIQSIKLYNIKITDDIYKGINAYYLNIYNHNITQQSYRQPYYLLENKMDYDMINISKLILRGYIYYKNSITPKGTYLYHDDDNYENLHLKSTPSHMLHKGVDGITQQMIDGWIDSKIKYSEFEKQFKIFIKSHKKHFGLSALDVNENIMNVISLLYTFMVYFKMEQDVDDINVSKVGITFSSIIKKPKSNMVINKYNLSYELVTYDDLGTNFNKTLLHNYLFPIDNSDIVPSLTDYYLSALYTNTLINTHHAEGKINITVANYIFSYFFYKLCKKNNIAYSNIKNTKYNENPFEFLYSYIIGYFPKKEQLELIDKIVKDITPYMPVYEPILVPMSGGSNTITNVYKSNINIPKIYNFSAGTVHTALMGSGKTTMITPLSILRYFQYICLNEERIVASIFLVMPEVLVTQSYNLLKKSLGTYFPINVSILNETRITADGLNNITEFSDVLLDYEIKNRSKTNDDIINDASFGDETENSYNTNVYIISDRTMKCCMLNNYSVIEKNIYNSAFIFDEIDTILNPDISELNYPNNKTKYTLSYMYIIYETIYDSLKDIFVLNTHKIDSFNAVKIPHFHMLTYDFESQKKIIDLLLNHIKIKCKDNPKIHHFLLEYNNIKNKDKQFKTLEPIIKELDKKEVYIAYVFLNFIYVAIPTVIKYIHRKNYGFGANTLFAIPYSYADAPKENSEFNNPVLTLCLTILSYMIDSRIKTPYINKEFNEFVIDMCRKQDFNDMNVIYVELTKIFGQERSSELYLFLKLQIISDTNIQQTITSNPLFIKLFCEHICSTKLIIYDEQSTITGLDLIMSFNARYKTGFTGTPQIPQFYDINPVNTMVVTKANQSDIDKIKIAFDNCYEYVINVNDNMERDEYINAYLEKAIGTIHNNNNNGGIEMKEDDKQSNNAQILDLVGKLPKVIIDAGAMLLGYEPLEIWKKIKNIRNDVSRFVYWNSKGENYIASLNMDTQVWDGKINEAETTDIFYYYDNMHCTGIDAKIPNNYVGAVLLGNNSRYRDIVQAIFRMRKIHETQRALFVITIKLKHNIEHKISTLTGGNDDPNKLSKKCEILYNEYKKLFALLSKPKQDIINKHIATNSKLKIIKTDDKYDIDTKEINTNNTYVDKIIINIKKINMFKYLINRTNKFTDFSDLIEKADILEYCDIFNYSTQVMGTIPVILVTQENFNKIMRDKTKEDVLNKIFRKIRINLKEIIKNINKIVLIRNTSTNNKLKYSDKAPKTIKWFYVLENEILEAQEETMKIHNIRALSRNMLTNNRIDKEQLVYYNKISVDKFFTYNTFKIPEHNIVQTNYDALIKNRYNLVEEYKEYIKLEILNEYSKKYLEIKLDTDVQNIVSESIGVANQETNKETNKEKDVAKDKHSFFAKMKNLWFHRTPSTYYSYAENIYNDNYARIDDKVLTHYNLWYFDRKKIYVILNLEQEQFFVVPYYDGLKFIEIIKINNMQLTDLTYSNYKDMGQYGNRFIKLKEQDDTKYARIVVYNAHGHICYQRIYAEFYEVFRKYNSMIKFILQVCNGDLYMRPSDYLELFYKDGLIHKPEKENECPQLLKWLYDFISKFGITNKFTSILLNITNNYAKFCDFIQEFIKLMSKKEMSLGESVDSIRNSEYTMFHEYALLMANHKNVNPFNT